MLGGVFEHRGTEVHALVVAHDLEDVLAGALDGAHVVFLEFVALLLHPAVVPVGHLELVDVTELRCALVQELEELRFGADARDLERGRQAFLASDVQNLLPLGAMEVAPLLEGRVEPNFVEAGSESFRMFSRPPGIPV